LIELLVVITIMGILAGIAIPAFRGFGKSNAMAAANRQLLDDIAGARSRAMAKHTTVYIVFVPPWVTDTTQFSVPGTDLPRVRATRTLYSGQYTTYALLTMRSVGEQPGRANPTYLTEWKSLPNGIYIATNKYLFAANYAPTFLYTNVFPFPYATNFPPAIATLPYIGFDYLGQLVSRQDEYIPLARGSIFFDRDATGTILPNAADARETVAGEAYYVSYKSINASTNGVLPPPDNKKAYNQIHIDWLTGRARVERQTIQ
jgi:type II secretory pathway pseudopilin PulG